MITVADPSRIVDTVQRLPPIDLDLFDAQGCVLAQDVFTQVALPGFRSSAMDGYAVAPVAPVEHTDRIGPRTPPSEAS